jgi:hypothetical protein
MKLRFFVTALLLQASLFNVNAKPTDPPSSSGPFLVQVTGGAEDRRYACVAPSATTATSTVTARTEVNRPLVGSKFFPEYLGVEVFQGYIPLSGGQFQVIPGSNSQTERFGNTGLVATSHDYEYKCLQLSTLYRVLVALSWHKAVPAAGDPEPGIGSQVWYHESHTGQTANYRLW